MSASGKVNIAFVMALTGIGLLDGLGSEVPVVSYVFLVVLYIAISAYGSFVLSAEYFLPAFSRAQNNGRMIAITFDDGPIRGKTDQILDILDQHQVKATFFCIGKHIRGNEDILSRIDRDGHLIGNHTFHHKKTFGLLRSVRILEELKATDREVQRVTGKNPVFFRPPFGVSNPMVACAVRSGQYKTIGWSVRSFDTIIKDPERLLRRIAFSPVPGDIILLHDYSQSTITMLPRLIAFLKRHNFQMVRVDELLNEEAYA
jgi:peptidoglycan-N-acetylglucosamine deacetylase